MTILKNTLLSVTSALSLGIQAQAQDNNIERYIVKYSPNNQERVEAEIALANGEIKLHLGNQRFYAVEMLPEDMNRLQSVAEIEFIEVDARNFLFAETKEYGIDMINVDETNPLHLSEATTTDRKVCIIDTGFDRNHIDLQNQRITGDDGIPIPNSTQQANDTGDWWIDENGHGTMMGGIIAALGNNNEGYVSVNPGNKLHLHIVKAFISPNGFGTQPFWVYTSDSIAALDQCLAAGSHIVNMSYGKPTYSLAENQAMIAAANAGTLLIAASGNDGGITPRYPATLDAVMSVSSVNNLEYPAEASQYHLSNEISAPGGRIFPQSTPVPTLPPVPPIPSMGIPIGELHSTYPSYGPNYTPPINNLSNAYASGTGSSMAAAYVSGVAAKVWAYHPNCSGGQIRGALLSSAIEKGPSGRDRYYGYGIVDAYGAHSALLNAQVPCNTPTPTQFMTNGGTQSGLTGGALTQLSYILNVGSNTTNLNSGPANTLKSSSSLTDPKGKLKNLSFALSGGAGNADLYVRFGDKPTLDTYDCRSNGADNEENCEFKKPEIGNYYVLVHGTNAFSGVSLTGSYLDKNNPPNIAPSARYSVTCEGLECSFDGSQSSDIDGIVSAYHWDFGDGSTGSGINPTHQYDFSGFYEPKLIVTDDDGAVGEETQILEVASINLYVRIFPIDGMDSVIMNWNGATAPKLDLYVNGRFSRHLENDGQDIRKAPKKPGEYTYQICNQKSTTLCSDNVTVNR